MIPNTLISINPDKQQLNLIIFFATIDLQSTTFNGNLPLLLQILHDAFSGQPDGDFRRLAVAFAESGEIPSEDVDTQLDGEESVKLFKEGDVVGVAVGVEKSEAGGGELAGGMRRNPPSVDRGRRFLGGLFHGDWDVRVFERDAGALVEIIKTVFDFFFREFVFVGRCRSVSVGCAVIRRETSVRDVATLNSVRVKNKEFWT